MTFSKNNIKKRRKDLTSIIAPLVVLAVLVIGLQIICTVFDVNAHVIPEPFDIITETVRVFPDILRCFPSPNCLPARYPPLFWRWLLRP